MKIGNPAADKPALVPVGPAATGAIGTGGANGAAKAAPATAIPSQADASAKIALSSTASTLLTSGANAEFDAEKVARISRSIDDGTFKVDAGAIADKLIANAQELLTKFQR